VENFGSGRLTLADILQPAIDMAERGFPVSPVTAYHWAKGVSQLKNGYVHNTLRSLGHRLKSLR
jgi:gamma-glutamyltranspeptidase/glutathione hydrolase